MFYHLNVLPRCLIDVFLSVVLKHFVSETFYNRLKNMFGRCFHGLTSKRFANMFKIRFNRGD